MNPNPASPPWSACPFCGADCETAVHLPAHRIVACRRCRIARTEPAPGSVPYEEGDFHAGFPYRAATDLPASWRRSLYMQRALLQRHLPGGARVLEIGCGQGLLLGHLAQAGFQVVGVEPSHSAATAAQAAGLDVRNGYFTRDTAPTGSFDAVIVSHVLEHIENPARFIADIAATAPGALLLLVQANWLGWVPRKNKANWHAWAEGHHYWHFTPRGLVRWLASQGCARVALELSSLEHGNYWLSRLARLFPGASDQFHLLVRLPRS